MTTYKGIDISNWQGSVDFSEVKNSGVQIVYIEATEDNEVILKSTKIATICEEKITYKWYNND